MSQPIKDLHQRDRIRTELDRCMLVEAAAGTGKTTSIVDRMLALLKEGRCNIDRLVAVTFTRKAAAELQERFISKLATSIRKEPGERRLRLLAAKENIDQGFIGTIHSFCSKLLRERPVEANVDISFEEIDEEADLLLRSEAWLSFIELAAKNRDLAGIQTLSKLGITLSDLEHAFFVYTNHPDVDQWPTGIPSAHNEDHKQALREYLDHLSGFAPTLPDDCGRDKLIPTLKKLLRQARHLDINKPGELISILETFEPKATIVKKKWPDQQLAQQEKDRFDQFRSDWALPALFDLRSLRYEPVLNTLHQAAVIYDRIRRERGVLNFNDLLTKTARLLEDHPHVRNYFHKRYTHLLVDEFQDTDPVQAKVLLLLTADHTNHFGKSDWTKLKPTPGSLFVVGDPKQSIYRFRRADITIYNRVKKILETDAPMVTLSVNFRTTQSVLNWINQTFKNLLPSTTNDASPSYLSLERGRSTTAKADLEGVWTLAIPKDPSATTTASVAHEADLIARFIRNALDKGLTVPCSTRELNAIPESADNGQLRKADASDFMIITYTKNNLSAYATALQAYGVSHEVTGGSVLNQTQELELLHICFEALVKPDNPIAYLALLRSELFGLSDRMLYTFKEAGGRFDYRLTLPESLTDEASARFNDITGRLSAYSRWLDELGSMPTIERMVSDLGLVAKAAGAPDGSMRSGSLYKALELLRAAKTKTAGPMELSDYLARIVDYSLTFDGMSALSEAAPSVKLMNLHKAKGLEAPVVFLADPNGGKPREPNLYIDRSDIKTNGYMLIEKPSTGFQKRPLAQPADWTQGSCLKDQELIFQQAERLRLLYVGATRAGSMLVIPQKTKQQGSNLWSAFEPFLHDCPEIEDPGPQKAPVYKTEQLDKTLFEQAKQKLETRKEAIKEPTYIVRSVREVALQPDEKPVRSGLEVRTGENDPGTEKGKVIHALLECAAKGKVTDLHQTAETLIREESLNPDWATSAVEIVNSVLKSKLWERLQKSRCWYTETPFAIPWQEENHEKSLAGVLRGVIDLLFMEPDGWVVVDYKTDRATHKNLPNLIIKYTPQVRLYGKAWSLCTSQPVKELGLFFTAPGEYVVIE